MRAVFRVLGGVTAAVVAAVSLYIAGTLPPAVLTLEAELEPAVVLGAYHVHTSRSDGSGTVEEVAAAAARAGLRFVIFTDHGDATRAPDPPVYRDGVLCLDAVEINTDGGHLVALGLTEASPYPLAGRPADVVEDVHRQGGWTVASHPDSPQPGMRWRSRGVPYDGLEWLNADTEWRDEPPGRVLATAARALFRAPEAVVSLFGRPDASLRRWDDAASERPIVGLAALDAHARIGWNDEAGQRNRHFEIAHPGYEVMFRALAQAVWLDHPPTGDADADARALLTALRAGRTFSIVRGRAGPAALRFGASQEAEETVMGGTLGTPGTPARFEAAVEAAPGARMVLFQNGQQVAEGTGLVRHAERAASGAYRVEVRLPGLPVPWIVSNPIYALSPSPGPRTTVAVPQPGPGPVLSLPPDAGWTIERHPASTAVLEPDGDSLRLEYALAGGAPAGQYVAAVVPVESNDGIEHVRFVVRAAAPMRLSLQLRLAGGAEGLRWRRSIYVGETPREVTVALEELAPVGGTSGQQPIAARVRVVLFVIDTVNSRPGSSGRIWISGVELIPGRAGDGGARERTGG